MLARCRTTRDGGRSAPPHGPGPGPAAAAVVAYPSSPQQQTAAASCLVCLRERPQGPASRPLYLSRTQRAEEGGELGMGDLPPTPSHPPPPAFSSGGPGTILPLSLRHKMEKRLSVDGYLYKLYASSLIIHKWQLFNRTTISKLSAWHLFFLF